MNKKKIYIIGGLFGLVGIFLVVFLTYPLFQEIKANSQELRYVEQEVYSLQNKMDSLREFEIEYGKYQSNLNKIDNLFINKEAPLGFIKSLENISKNISFEIFSITHSSEEEGLFSDKLFFNISLEGYYENVLRFLRKLENTPYLISIQNFNLREPIEEEIEHPPNYVEGSLLIKVFAK